VLPIDLRTLGGDILGGETLRMGFGIPSFSFRGPVWEVGPFWEFDTVTVSGPSRLIGSCWVIGPFLIGVLSLIGSPFKGDLSWEKSLGEGLETATEDGRLGTGTVGGDFIVDLVGFFIIEAVCPL
jgi:hypothetical protein